MWKAFLAALSAVILVTVVLRPDVADALERDAPELHPTYVVGPSDVTVDFISARTESHELALDLELVNGEPVEVLLVPVEAVTFLEPDEETHERGLLIDEHQAIESILLTDHARIALVTAPDQMYGLVLRGPRAREPAPPAGPPDLLIGGSGVAVRFSYPDDEVLGARIVAYLMMTPGVALLAGLAYRDVRRRHAPV